MFTIRMTPSSAQELESLPRKFGGQVAKAIRGLADNPFPPGAKKLSGSDGIYRIRSGDFRILYQPVQQTLVVLIIKVGNRRDVYR